MKHLDDLFKRPAAMKAEILRLRSEVQGLRQQVAAAEERRDRALHDAQAAWKYTRELERRPWTPPR